MDVHGTWQAHMRSMQGADAAGNKQLISEGPDEVDPDRTPFFLTFSYLLA